MRDKGHASDSSFGDESVEQAQGRLWVLLVYKVPREPTSSRAYIWRKLKKLGAVLIHDAVWVLPATDWTREQLQWLSVEISELGGDAFLWESRLLLGGREENLVQLFQDRVDPLYQEILDELEHDEADLIALSRKYQHTRAQDYFQSPLGMLVRRRILIERGGHEK